VARTAAEGADRAETTARTTAGTTAGTSAGSPAGTAPGGPAELSTEVVHEQLRESILRGEFDPHVPISQVQLAKRLGVSRTPLREALRMLQREGLIDSEPNRRVRVAALSVADVEQLYAGRLLVDTLALRLSVPRYTAADMAEMEDCVRRMSEMANRDMDTWEVAHRDYHELLRKYAGERFDRIAGDLSDHAERYRRVYLAEPRAWTAAAAEHQAILEACRARDAAAAGHHLARHLARTALTIIAQAAPEHDPLPVREALRLVTAGQDEDAGAGPA
jgi:DNA-binding GntR family transcriptional regulator